MSAQATDTSESAPLQPTSGLDIGYLPIRLHFLEFQHTAPCDLFREFERREYVLVIGRTMPFGPGELERLRSLGVEQLFIRAADAPAFFSAVRDALSALVRNPSVPARDKAQAVHAACHEALRRVFSDPRAPFIAQAQEVLAPTVDLILDDQETTRHLVRITAYDHATYIHSTNVGIFSLALGRIFLGESSMEGLRRAGIGFFLHDLGKCRIPLSVLNKPGTLSEEEKRLMNSHPEEGWRILRASGHLPEGAENIVLQHHEKDDGSGYPAGLKSDDIHPYARICRLADVYEALTSERPYHQRHSTFQALKIMRDRVMSDADQDLLRHFIGLFSD